MNYILPESSFGIMDAGMARKTQQQLIEIGQQAADLALARIPAAEDTVPADYTPSQRRRYLAEVELMRQPGGIGQREPSTPRAKKETRWGLLGGFFHS